MAKAKVHYFYVLYCKDNTLYGGYTTNLKRRLDEHNSGRGAKYTRPKRRRPAHLIYAERWGTKSEAMSAEYKFKQLTRPQKEKYLKDAGQNSVLSRQTVIVNKINNEEEGEL